MSTQSRCNTKQAARPSLWALIIFLVLGLSACGDGGIDTNSTASDEASNGQLELAITDAEEDFLTYRITLSGVTLERRDGSRVDILPLQSTIDFVQYQELSELFAVLSVPSGVYEKISLQLDYSNADIVIQNDVGESFVATAIDAEGNSVGQLDVELQLGDGEYIVITPRKTAALTLDLDLAASNTIESFEPAIVRVEPFMLGTVFLDNDREHRLRGLLQNVVEAEQSFTVAIRPMRLKHGNFGEFSVTTDSETLFEVNGIEYQGDAGLTALAELDAGTPVVSYGSPSQDGEQLYVASQVHAGSSVAWSESDVLKGIVTARSGNTLTLRGAVLELADGSAHFRQTVTLSVDDATTVSGYRLGDADITTLSVGQQLLALGEYDASSGDFDASGQHVRMKVNRIVGHVAHTLPLQLDVSHINRRPIELFDFAGTGFDSLSDANPENYEINTSSIDTTGLEADELIQVRGYPTAFGSAPMDFDAISIFDPDFSNHPARLLSYWGEDRTDAVLVSSGALQLNSDKATMKLQLQGIPGSIALEMQVATIMGTETAGRYAILARDSGIHVYREFASFSAALDRFLQSGREVAQLTAAGFYSASTENLNAGVVTVRMTKAPE